MARRVNTMKNLDSLLLKIHSTPLEISFEEIIQFVDNNYQYTPTEFINGDNEHAVLNKAGENEGSCKVFSFAQLHNLNKEQTLHCFGDYYRVDVLQHPNNKDHANIRTFIEFGWEHIKFNSHTLTSL